MMSVATKDGIATRTKLLDAARDVIRARGYTATTVDDICVAAGLSKGSFFHHFASKEALGIAAIAQFAETASAIFGSAPYSRMPDPRDRVLGYVDFRISMLKGEIAQFTCLMGTTVQEVYATHPDLRAACDQGMSAHIAELERDIEAAKEIYATNAPWSAQSVGYFMQATLQGAFIFAKAKQSPEVAHRVPGTLAALSSDTYRSFKQTNEGRQDHDHVARKAHSRRNAHRDAPFDLRGRGGCYRVLQECVQCRGIDTVAGQGWETHACQHPDR
jgi:TetR/AcrR family transcriptional repressor of nem operon